MSDTRHRLNCWEFKNCGREPGGLMAGVMAECPAAKAMKLDGVNGGGGGGRACWLVNSQSGCPAHACRRVTRCQDCEFYRRVVFEEEGAAACTFRNEPM